MKKQGIESFFKPVSTNSNVAKETNPVDVEYKLDYNEVNDNVTCFICKKHLQKLDQEKNKDDAFLHTGFHNWKKALLSFRDHQQPKCHLATLTSEVTVPQCLDVVAIANLFAESNNNRKRMFVKFTEKDLNCLVSVSI